MANRVESPYFLPWRGRTPLASIDPASATKSYTKPKVYLPPASPLMRPGELFGLGAILFILRFGWGGEVSSGDRLWCAGPQRIAAHLALDPTRHLPSPAAHRPLFQDLVQHRLMQDAPVPGGKAQRTAAACAGRRAPRARRRGGRGPHRLSGPLRALARARRNAPATGPKTPAGPAPGSCCAAPPAPRAAASSVQQGRLRSPSARDRARPVPPRAPVPDRGSWSPAV